MPHRLSHQNKSGPSGATCRSCGQALEHVFLDLGYSPLANSYLKPEQLNHAEKFYPLRVLVCEKCLLVQLAQVEAPNEIFSDYAYFSSYSDSWLRHAKGYVDLVMEQYRLDASSLVIEVASNDGYLLQYFHEQGVPVLGIEPAANIARHAEAKGIPTRVRFFNRALAQELADAGTKADLVLGNNVLAHVPDVHDFVAGMKLVLKPAGIVTMEFPHLLDLLAENQFDTIYHEHFSYFSFDSAERLFAAHGLTVFDVEHLSTHGGSLRIWARHDYATGPAVSPRVAAVHAQEARAKLDHVEAYDAFWSKVKTTKLKLLRFLVEAQEAGQVVAAYGAPAKGNTLLNYCGVGRDMIAFTVDRSPHKQGMFLPGSHIPIFAPEKIEQTKPDYLLILPWNLKHEIMQQTSYIRAWGGKWVVPIPEVQVYEAPPER